MITPYSHYTNEELLKLVFHAEEQNPLMMEVAYRLEQMMDENEYLLTQEDD